MNSLTDSSESLVIQEHFIFTIKDFQVEIQSYLGHFTDVDYFKVIILNRDPEDNQSQFGLLRVGSPDGGLQRELQLREILGYHKMVSALLASETQESVVISSRSQLPEQKAPLQTEEAFSSPKELLEEPDTHSPLEDESEYLEEVYYEEKEVGANISSQKLIVLSELLSESNTLEAWLQNNNSPEQCLLLASQVCQFFKSLYQKGWCVISIFPQFIEMGTPIQFFDLTGVYPVNEKLNSGLIGDYYAPEIALGHLIAETMSSYVVGVLLYQALHQKLPPRFEGIPESADSLDLKISKIPRIYQILTITLSSIPEERFPLSQLLSLLVETRQSLRSFQVRWEVANRSTLGLSTSRLQNEDNYGIRQQPASHSDPWLLAVVADGMGGLAQGEVASQLAVETVLGTAFPANLNHALHQGEWLISLVEAANEQVSNTVRDGGTTISVVFAVGRELAIAHVGDSRILLLRKGIICQLSEDHSMVAMLLASGEISYQESQQHPDRNVLTKSLGSKRRLSPGYVQDLSRFGGESFLTLEDGDILLLCSDGVWDLVSNEELATIFNEQQNLQGAVNTAIEQVLERGASDNATLVALKCSIETALF
ncbi:Serine/threonine phosphatase stp [Planktothrix tepida]|uniref:Protein serine/threonine phosphatases n=1 Tax=Planktothrix tepida PCC 9214 TaxID=671072 RepID=A0A1J1LTA6_9CYAN|nr:protein phosphatase 2C domain-containing protein [Planktothrix tepida]CAD5989257.1 Serine/threonine phosphatase stp [Planktothrix tepida]CUR35446.1 Protein serine/threonine phosphatases [Planktothrix tepida PCC 9214]